MTNQASEPERFRTFEHAGWERIGAAYHEGFAGLTTQAISPLLAVVRAGAGVTLLDIATGPGYVAAAVAKRGAEVIGVDFSAAMVAQARELFPRLDFREGDAEALPFADASFDSVVMSFGLVHLARPDQALAEAYRVLRPRGHLGFTLWANPNETVAFGLVLQAVQTHGTAAVSLPPGPSLLRFSDADECRKILLSVGFTTPTVEQIPQIWRLPSVDTLLAALENGTVRNAALLRGQTPQALAAIHEAIHVGASAYEQAGMLEIPMPAVLVSAVKP